MKKPRYYNSAGREVSSRDATDAAGMLKNSYSMRVPLHLADQARHGGSTRDDDGVTGAGERGQLGAREGAPCTLNGYAGVLRKLRDGSFYCDIGKAADSATITDGRSNDVMSLHRPGYRMAVVQDRKQLLDAYDAYEKRACNSWRLRDGVRLCSACSGPGIDDEDGSVCDECSGDGVVDNSSYDSAKQLTADNTQVKHRNDGATLDRDKAYAEYDEQLRRVYLAK